ncbi:unnamed protein product [Tilletia laevis]|uniref:ASTRA-associated protein 1 n=1 Tax=Tilletia laevis TaxID=157183 RepID=A0A9N8Q972_9BASI|nr:hypothetical protein CF335_g3990 [Tilletia laevis]CAD6896069.1 unnamed protein product [Tilletia caries]CAD6905342.1 unnamed protein product [Tilletia laevis]
MSSNRNPKPHWILRHHAPASIHALAFASPKTLSSAVCLLSGDGDGRVALTDLRSYRPRAFWQAHSDIILTVAEHDGFLLTHGRDNTLKVWKERGDALDDEAAAGRTDLIGQNAAVRVELPTAANLMASLPKPECILTLDVNALNYCSFALLNHIPTADLGSPSQQAVQPFLLAVPHTIETAWIDIYEMPAKKRIFEAIGRPAVVDRSNRPPILMAVHLFQKPAPEEDSRGNSTSVQLFLLAGYEDGTVSLRRLDPELKTCQTLWTFREHHEPVMALALSPDCTFALSASADDRIVRYSLFPKANEELARPFSHKTQRQGKASITISGDSRIGAFGGWDGNVRIYNAQDFRPLAVLDYHKDTIQAVAFQLSSTAPSNHAGDVDSGSDSDESDAQHGQSQHNLLACGCRDGRISLWQLTF